jgi:arylsulfatase A-like enzyme
MDNHVAKILKALEESGELENTLIVFTSDHGMPFPRVKGNEYENANHIPMAIMWKNGIKNAGRTIDDYVSFIDLAPTFLEAAGITAQQSLMQPITGKSLFNLFNASKSGKIDPSRNYLLVGQERHDFGRPHDVGYPIRGIHKNNMLFLKNYEPNRWPVCNPETGYLNCDGGATKTFILNQRRSGLEKNYWKMCFGHRLEKELYDTKTDPDCVHNLMSNPKYKTLAAQLEKEMEAKLKQQGDLRMFGYGHLYEQAPFAEVNGFYERFMKGEKIKTGWVEPTDYEQEAVTDY